MPLIRLESKKELLEFVVALHSQYSKILAEEPSDFIPRLYLKDILNELLIIQHYASKKDDATSTN